MINENKILKNIEEIIKRLENCKEFVLHGRNPDEYEEKVLENYNTSVFEIKLILKKLKLNSEEINYDCPILITGLDFLNIEKEITQSIHFLKALKNHIISFETDESKELIKKYKKSFEIEGGLPFLKGKFKHEER